jgi:hypothetical protein
MIKHDTACKILIYYRGLEDTSTCRVEIHAMDKNGKEEERYFFYNDEMDDSDVMIAGTLQLAVNWWKTNTGKPLNPSTIIYLSIKEESAEQYYSYHKEEQENLDEVFEEKTISQALYILERNKKLSKIRHSEQFSDDAFKAYLKLHGAIPKFKFDEYLKFFIHIIPTTFIGHGSDLGLNRYLAYNIWEEYIILNGYKTKEADVIFKAVESLLR